MSKCSSSSNAGMKQSGNAAAAAVAGKSAGEFRPRGHLYCHASLSIWALMAAADQQPHALLSLISLSLSAAAAAAATAAATAEAVFE